MWLESACSNLRGPPLCAGFMNAIESSVTAHEPDALASSEVKSALPTNDQDQRAEQKTPRKSPESSNM